MTKDIKKLYKIVVGWDYSKEVVGTIRPKKITIVEEDIVKETPKSYVLNIYDREIKVNKKTLNTKQDSYGNMDKYYLSKEDAENTLWITRNKYALVEAVRFTQDYNILKQIAILVGYNE